MFNHDKNYTELCVENYFLRKITQPYQNNLQYSKEVSQTD